VGLHWLSVGAATFAEPAWTAPPGHLVQRSGEVHIWRAFMGEPSVGIPALEEFLDEEERERTARFFFAEDRRRYEVAHYVLREVLSRYLGSPPGRVRISKDLRGKPKLEGESAVGGVRFSMSRSRSLVLIAVAWNREVGIDVEYIAPDPIDISIAQRRFSEKEVAILRGLDQERRPEAFFWLWVRKEACLKAAGKGLSLPLDSVDASLGITDFIEMTACPDPVRWSSITFKPERAYAAALCTTGEEVQVRCMEWSRPWSGVEQDSNSRRKIAWSGMAGAGQRT
jgi:4'-phosphopantetheinyl transferase